MGWKYDSIAAERASKVSECYGDASRDDLLARIVELETQLYPLYVALSPITEKSWRGTSASSKLFPTRPEGDEDGFMVFNRETREMDTVKLDEKDLAAADYVTEDGIMIEDGANLADDFEILSFHQQAPGAYVGNGSVFVGDVRRLIDVLCGPYKAKSGAA